MPVQFKILPQYNLVVFTYSGHVTFQETSDVVAAAAADPDHRHGMRQLCDVSGVTEVERDFPALMKMQARLAESMIAKGPELLVLFYAPNLVGREMAEMARRSWDGLESVIVMVQDQEDLALTLLGIPANSLEHMLNLTD